MAHLEFFPESLTQLRIELLENHRDILEKIKQDAKLEDSLGEVAAELGVLTHGVYDLDDVCKVLLVALKARAAKTVIQVVSS